MNIFHLTDIEVHEVSLVDHGAIDHDFTNVKSALAGYRWLKAQVKDAAEKAQISVESLAEKSGINSTELEAITAGQKNANIVDLRKIAQVLGLKGATVPKPTEAEMDEKGIKALIVKALEPLTKAFNDMKALYEGEKTLREKAVKDAADAKAAAEKLVADKTSGVPEEVLKRLDAAEKTAADFQKLVKDDLDDMEKQVKERFDANEKAAGLTGSQKIAGQDEPPTDGGTKTRFPSFAGVGYKGIKK